MDHDKLIEMAKAAGSEGLWINTDLVGDYTNVVIDECIKELEKLNQPTERLIMDSWDYGYHAGMQAAIDFLSIMKYIP